MNILKSATMALATASGGSPIVSTVTIILFYCFFNFWLASVERLLFGERLEHWLDPLFTLAFIAWSAYAVYCCAIFNYKRNLKAAADE